MASDVSEIKHLIPRDITNLFVITTKWEDRFALQ